jgi:ribosomal protein S18 acetylase RimI-like enzyme
VNIRALRADDIDAVVEFSVRAWRPVFESFMEVMGPDIFRRIYPHWQAGQADAVRDACRDEAHRTWVAEAPESANTPDASLAPGTPDAAEDPTRAARPIAFVVVAVHDDPRRGEIYMIAVDPDYQDRGIGLAVVNFATDRPKSVPAATRATPRLGTSTRRPDLLPFPWSATTRHSRPLTSRTQGPLDVDIPSVL